MKNYRTTEVETGIERYENEENAIVIYRVDGVAILETYSRGYPDAKYRGSNLEWARKSLGISQSEFDDLLLSDPDFLEVVG